MQIVQLCDFGSDGDAEYRMHAPSRALGALPGVSATDCHFDASRARELALDADVLLLQFHNDWDVLSLVAERRRRGAVTVFEANDYFFDLQPWSPLRQWWNDRTVQELYGQLLRACDGVQTSSQSLARQWRRRGARETVVFANHLESVPELAPAPERPLTVGWAGSPGHFADWWSVLPALSQWLRDHPDVHLAVMTNELARGMVSLPPERYSFTPFGTLTEYLAFLARLDIGLAPLLPTEYNLGRSDVKFLEYASHGVVGVYADRAPYDGVDDGRTGLKYQNPGQLMAALTRLHDDAQLRARIRRDAHAHVQHQRVLSAHIGERVAWYDRLSAAAGRKHLPGAGAPRPRTADAGYHQVRGGGAEARLGRARSLADASESLSALEGLLADSPDFLAAMHHKGFVLNNLGRAADAAEVLEAAGAVAPESARIRAELGRSQLLLHEEKEAKRSLVNAITHTPGFVPGWRYLVRTLRVTKDPESQVWAARALESFPTCYPLGLDAVDSFGVNDAARQLASLMVRTAPTLGDGERSSARSLFRDKVRLVLSAHPDADAALAMLTAASGAFPESPSFAGWHGDVLLQLGNALDGTREMARAADLMSAAAAVTDEFGPKDDVAWPWLFAQHVRSTASG